MRAKKNVLEVKDTRIGGGDLVMTGSHVVINCVIRLINKYHLMSEKKTFVVEEGGEAGGLVEGLIGMKVGGKRTIQGPARWWYGEDATPEGIPSNVGLMFEVELLAIS
jgi:FKBP-type peptidyl-prolyl cis-trans isomerase